MAAELPSTEQIFSETSRLVPLNKVDQNCGTSIRISIKPQRKQTYQIVKLTPLHTKTGHEGCKRRFWQSHAPGMPSVLFLHGSACEFFLSCARENVLASAEETWLFKSSGLLTAEFMPNSRRKAFGTRRNICVVIFRCTRDVFLRSTLFFSSAFQVSSSSQVHHKRKWFLKKREPLVTYYHSK